MIFSQGRNSLMCGVTYLPDIFRQAAMPSIIAFWAGVPMLSERCGRSVVVVEVALQGGVHGLAGEFAVVEAPALDAGGAVGALDDAVEFRAAGWQHLEGRLASDAPPPAGGSRPRIAASSALRQCKPLESPLGFAYGV